MLLVMLRCSQTFLVLISWHLLPWPRGGPNEELTGQGPIYLKGQEPRIRRQRCQYVHMRENDALVVWLGRARRRLLALEDNKDIWDLVTSYFPNPSNT